MAAAPPEDKLLVRRLVASEGRSRRQGRKVRLTGGCDVETAGRSGGDRVRGSRERASAQAERRVALVIGNSAYMHTSALRNPKNDATDLTATLKQVGFEVHLGLDLDQRGFALILDKFVRELDGADVGLLFYAGHALQISEKNYLVSTNARLESEFLITSEAIELEPIIRLMESKAPINLIFLDACRNNPLADSYGRPWPRSSAAAISAAASRGWSRRPRHSDRLCGRARPGSRRRRRTEQSVHRGPAAPHDQARPRSLRDAEGGHRRRAA